MVTVAFQVVDVVRTELRSRSPMWRAGAGVCVGEAVGADVAVKVGRGVDVVVAGMDVKVGRGVGDAGIVVFVGRGVSVSDIAVAVNVGKNVAVATGAPASH